MDLAARVLPNDVELPRICLLRRALIPASGQLLYQNDKGEREKRLTALNIWQRISLSVRTFWLN